MLDGIEKIMSGGVCSCGKTHGMATGTAVVGDGAADSLAQFIREKNFQRVLIVCDTNTEKYVPALKPAAMNADVITLPGNSHADEKGVAPLIDRLNGKSCDCLIACGSGSLHDITRYSANEKKIPFVSFPTAASVDGFVSTVAAMTWGGQKLSSPAAAPIAVFADPKVFGDAPARLTASGVGDLLGKYTALLDWRIARILTGEEICPEIYGLMEKALGRLDGLLDEISSGQFDVRSEKYTTLVMECLILAGLSMQLQGNSRPASGAEHHLSHFWEMHVINKPTDALHGEQVGVAALMLTRYYHAMRDYDFMRPVNLAATFDRSYLEPVYGDLTDGILRENLTDGEVSSSPLAFVPDAEKAEKVRAEIDSLISPEALERLLRLGGAPTTLSELGLPDDEEFIARTLGFAPYVRKRLTLLKVLSAKR